MLIQGIPRYFSSETVLEVFGKGDGKIVGVELPKQNLKLKELRHSIENQKDSPSNLEKEEHYRRAKMVVQ